MSRDSAHKAILIADADAALRRKIAREVERHFDVVEAGDLDAVELALRQNGRIVALVIDRRAMLSPRGSRLASWLGRARPELARIWVSSGRSWQKGAILQAVRACSAP